MKKLIFLAPFTICIYIFMGLISGNGNVKVTAEGKPIYTANPRLYFTFTEFFSDSLAIYVNKKKIKVGFFKTNESTTVAGTFVLSSQQLKTAHTMTVNVISKGKTIKTISFNLKKGYSNAIVEKENNMWSVLFTNREIEYE